MIIKFLSVAALLFIGAFLFFNAGNLNLPAVFITGNETTSSEEVAAGPEDSAVADVEEETPIEVDEIGELSLPGENVTKTEPHPSAFITELGVFVWTNFERVNSGLEPLSRNALLDQVAGAKLNDMFAKQYFAHGSPSGDYINDLAVDFGYEYLLIGENLAYGDFANDKELVDAWMNSKGHRENILNKNYEEIGIAVGREMFNGRETWIAVQSFGTPYSKCDFVDESLLQDINEGKDELEELEDLLSEMRDEIEATNPKSGPEYNAMVAEYNDLVGEYNALLKEINALVKTYNGQVEELQICVEAIQ